MSATLKLELYWWLFTIIVAIAVLVPIYQRLPDYPFYTSNILHIVLFVTFTRYAFLLPHTFLARRQLWKGIVFVLCLFVLFRIIENINFFQTWLDEEGTDALVGHLAFDQRKSMIDYVRSEYLLFGVGSAIATVFLQLRLIVSAWRFHNYGKV